MSGQVVAISASQAAAADASVGCVSHSERKQSRERHSNPHLRVVDPDDTASAKPTVVPRRLRTPAGLIAEETSTELQTLAPLTRLRKGSPLRPLDWRWQRACYLRLKGNRPSRSGDDRQIAAAWRFQKVLAGCETAEHHERLRDAAPGIYAAYEIRRSPEEGFRWELEARLLSGMSYSAIADKMDLPSATVAAFEALFFNVADKLKAPSFIFHRAIRCNSNGGLTANDIGTLWRFYAYVGGPIILDDLVRQLPRSKKPTDRSEVQQFFAADTRASLHRKAAIAMRCMPMDDPQTAIKLMRLSLHLKETDAKRRARECEHADITLNVQVFLDQLRTSLDGKVVFGRVEGQPLPTFGAGILP